MAKQKYVLTEIEVSDFEPGAVPTPGRFKLVSPCAEPENRRSAAVLTAISALKSTADQRQALAGLKHLLKVAQLGKPFNLLLDKDAVHEAFPAFFCEITQRYETVWRYRRGDIRILFYYAADKVVLLTHTLPKRTNRLSAKDIEQAKQAVNDFLTATRTLGGLKWI
jgi:mRNA-degrading endonuclease RelE of RelBE toxin-antitoxin system